MNDKGSRKFGKLITGEEMGGNKKYKTLLNSIQRRMLQKVRIALLGTNSPRKIKSYTKLRRKTETA